jgi:hypothetical protein
MNKPFTIDDKENSKSDTAVSEHLFSDLSKLRMSQDFIGEAGVKKHLATVPVRKPHKHDWFRVHPSETYRETFGLIPLGADKEFYLVAPVMVSELVTEVAPFRIYCCVNRQGTVTLWPVRLPGPDGKDMEWWRSAHEAAAGAMTVWTRLTANKDLGAYDIATAPKLTAEPGFPDQPFAELLRIAFRDRLIDRIDHEVVRKLRGLV